MLETQIKENPLEHSALKHEFGAQLPDTTLTLGSCCQVMQEVTVILQPGLWDRDQPLELLQGSVLRCCLVPLPRAGEALQEPSTQPPFIALSFLCKGFSRPSHLGDGCFLRCQT